MYVEYERSAVKREALAEVCLGLLQSLWLKKRKSKKKDLKICLFNDKIIVSFD